MFYVFQNYILKKIDLTDEQLAYVASFAIHKRVRKRQFLLNEGDVSRYHCFVVKGCLRLFRVAEDGTEHNLNFSVEECWICDRESFYSGQPSKCNIEALEDSEIYMWAKNNFEKLISEIPVVQRFVHGLIERGYIASQNRNYSLLSLTAEEKYLDFISNHPDIYNRVPLHMVASYLGVTRETLSRIRRDSILKFRKMIP